MEMTVVVEVARQGSFSGAARRLDLSPSAVSKLVTRMEQRLDSRLFNRTTRRLSLTEGGRQFHDRCLQILDQIEAAEEQLLGYQRAPMGELKVTCSPAFARYQLLPLMPEFLAACPQLEVNLRITGESLNLITHDIDVAIRHGRLEDSSLVARQLAASRRVVCASPAYLDAHGTPDKPADLSQHNCLSSASGNLKHWRFTRRGRDQEVTVSGNFSCDTVEALRDLALRGMGIVNLAEFVVAPDLKSGDLRRLLPGYRSEAQPLHVVYPHRLQLPSKVRVFVEFLVERYSPDSPWVEKSD